MKRVTLFAILLLGVAGCTKGFEPDNTARNPENNHSTKHLNLCDLL